MDYFELRSIVSKIIPRLSVFEKSRLSKSKEKGRKKNYHQFNFETGKWDLQQRNLNENEIQSFIEVSLRSQACPMSLNIDTLDGLTCRYNCLYCLKAGTKITTKFGDKDIENIKVGDELLTYNESLKGIEYKSVKKTMMRKAQLYKLVVDDKEIFITGEHPVFTKRGWIPVKELTLEDEVLQYVEE